MASKVAPPALSLLVLGELASWGQCGGDVAQG